MLQATVFLDDRSPPVDPRRRPQRGTAPAAVPPQALPSALRAASGEHVAALTWIAPVPVAQLDGHVVVGQTQASNSMFALPPGGQSGGHVPAATVAAAAAAVAGRVDRYSMRNQSEAAAAAAAVKQAATAPRALPASDDGSDDSSSSGSDDDDDDDMEYPPGFEPPEATALSSSDAHWSVAATSARDSQSALGTTSLSQHGGAREKRPRDGLPGPVDGVKATAYKCVRPDSWSGHASGSRQFRTAAPAAVHGDAQQDGRKCGKSSNFLEPGEVVLNGRAVARLDDLQGGEQEHDHGVGGSSKE